jgi:hypothetical protein
MDPHILPLTGTPELGRAEPAWASPRNVCAWERQFCEVIAPKRRLWRNQN